MSSLRNTARERSDETKFSALLLQVQTEQVRNKIVFVVEGDSDITLFNMVLRNTDFFYCTPASGKNEVVKAVRKLKTRISNQVYGIVDADFDHLLENTYDDTFLTDVHDAEIMMLHDEFITDFITEHTKTDSLVHMKIDEVGQGLMNDLMSVCNKIGLIKLACRLLDLNVRFKGMNYTSCGAVMVNGFDLSINIEALIDSAIERSPREEQTNSECIINKYNELANAGHCIYQTANGHDFCQLLAQVFKQPFSSDRKVTDKAVEKYLRSKYTSENFAQTNLYERMVGIIKTTAEIEKVA
ncbi:DUF4435 domain-containing protein [Vibrio vulnificus]|uniref:DUF4435 domain-containing protein n=1 Tax=Vibrio vulnificus TaxID=672 RepID=UPI000505A1A2|nr:DUF4435 domain-containing protein [Vibrio vulnificus]ASJ41393.1 hypothetical protein VVCECT4999_22435 [Vibrio vulnificus]EGQ9973385.1 DUF4435 domain-containing protein [Vibrio vulnificus]EGR0059081.1 DUF4435 domain-containing protein [Vibrio vulnificus]EGR0350840.1 DUF4435 domain-containing protein [Vibrio vulnificus]EGR0639004.1 DUF4435 domain-containing protein [Vibrio vulnificus]